MTSAPARFRPLHGSPTGRIALAMLLGIAAGLAFGPRTAGCGEVGKVLINVIKALAAPLLAFAVVDAFLRTKVQARSALRMVAVAATNAALAVTIGLALINLLQPGKHLAVPPADVAAYKATAAAAHPIRFTEEVLGLIPTNLVEPFRTNAVVSIILIAVFAGLALRKFKDEQVAEGKTDYLAVEGLVSGGFRAVEIMLGWAVLLLPLAVFGVMAETVGKQGLAPLRGLAIYVGVVVLGLSIQVAVVYQFWVVCVAKKTLRWFWAGALPPVAFAAGASSSLATLPVTLRSLKAMGVSDESARLSACVGTNLNNDGILLYEALAAIFVAQVFDIDLTLGRQLLIAATCVLAGVGIAGVPEAGLISLALVLSTAGLPLEILPLLLSVDWFVSRCRAVTNVISDLVVAVVLDSLAARDATAVEPAVAAA